MWWPRLDVGARCQVAGERHDVCTAEKKKSKTEKKRVGASKFRCSRSSLCFRFEKKKSEEMIRSRGNLGFLLESPSTITIWQIFFFFFQWVLFEWKVRNRFQIHWILTEPILFFFFFCLGFCFAFLWSFIFYFFCHPTPFAGDKVMAYDNAQRGSRRLFLF